MSRMRDEISLRCFYLGVGSFAVLGTIIAALGASCYPYLAVEIFALWIGLFFIVALLVREYGVNLCSASQLLTPLSMPGPNDTVLFIAPHPDDETLAAFALLRRTAATGAKVKLVLITNGESFIDAAQLFLADFRCTANSCREFAAHRQGETLVAAQQMGLAPEDVFFLGFPDGGLEQMCSGNWSDTAPYINFCTKYRQTDFPGAYRPGTPYTKAGLMQVLTDLMASLQPTFLILPHPEDTHPDHRTACAVAQEAAKGATLAPCPQLHYLVHYPGWPAPWSLTCCLYLVPPRDLRGDNVRWETLALTPEEIRAKGLAIANYPSQLSALAPLMRSFQRRNELFCRFPD